MTDERREKLRQNQKRIWLGRKVTEEHRKNLSLSHKGKVPSKPFRKGHIPWNKGGTHSEVTRQKLSRAAKGRVAWNKGLIGFQLGHPPTARLIGIKNPMWKGGITSESEKIRKSTKYIQWRTKIFQRDKYICQICKQVGGKLNADHILTFSLFEESRFDLDNGRTLCVECHKKTDTYAGRISGYKKITINVR